MEDEDEEEDEEEEEEEEEESNRSHRFNYDRSVKPTPIVSQELSIYRRFEVYRWENDITFIDRYLITRIRLPIYYPINVGTSFLVNSTGTLPLKFLPTSDLHLLVYAIQSRRIVANFDSPEALVLALVLASCSNSGSSSGYEVNVDRGWPTLPIARNFVKSTDSGLTSPNFLEQPMEHDLYTFVTM
ncbi:hypothetical protein HZH68_014339 [Vespula germanica]|uniref:Uncharacterized protein n=1 Tax=Vespula germanica TaxID=30212 RepID=A0A834JB48_VESGE|nr:hypothetical protein HZH68_014339 [Vespula germanica]